MKKPKLTNKQAKFVEEYLVDLNATQAAIRAGYSKKTARAMGTENLAKPAIAQEISKHALKATENVELTVETVLKNIAAMHEMAATEKHFGGMGKALELQAKYLKMLTDRTELTGKNGGAIEISELSEQERINRLRQITG